MAYIIGIDLGTTNCTVSYLNQDTEQPHVEQFLIPQLISAGTINEDAILPSFIYFPLQEELAKGAAKLPWDESRTYAVGQYAKERGAEAPDRLVASAKSWLCHSGLDRRAAILPSTEGAQQKISPLDASAYILTHIREAWNYKMEDISFEQQEILITVPASFDPSARQLVQEAAKIAGYPDVILLEEPQAAFYAWLNKHAEDWRNQLKVDDTILVVDIGGGTTDFSTIKVQEENGNLQLERQAVGSHLLLGGDNIDLALAYLAKDKFEEKGSHIDDWQLHQLVHACRRGKEKILGSNDKSFEVAVTGRGSKLVGGTIKAKLTQEEVENVLCDGFFPSLPPTEQSKSEIQSGLKQMGLPYAQDPRITAQLAKFLSMTGEGADNTTERFIIPSAILFNGGTMKAKSFRERILTQLNEWAAEFSKASPKELPAADYDYSVSAGAAYYGLARKGKALRIKAGTSRSYFVGIEDAAPAVPGRQPKLKAICIAPFGMEEGTETELKGKEFTLLLGEKATFRFFSHATSSLPDGSTPEVGVAIPNWQKDLTELHPIETILKRSENEGKAANVTLKARVTELGVLELWCETQDARKWKLEFDIRNDMK